jgi:hypothetical protein
MAIKLYAVTSLESLIQSEDELRVTEGSGRDNRLCLPKREVATRVKMKVHGEGLRSCFSFPKYY